MLSLLLLAALSLSPQVDDGQDVPPLPPAIQQAVTDLDNALETKIEGAIVSALLRHQDDVHPVVIERVVKALGNRKSGVRKTALVVLRFMDHEDALKALIEFCKQDKRILQDPDQLERTLRALGQHASERTREFFTEPDYESVDEHVLRARIRGLGRLRSNQSVAELIAMFDTKEPWKPIDFMADFRLSLVVLTGVDRGINPADWKRWWVDAEAELTVDPKLPELELLDLREWYSYWDLPLPEGISEDKEHPRRGDR